MATKVHRVFVSYHHYNDQIYRDKFENLLKNTGIAVVRSVQLGDIDPNLNTDTIRRRIREDYLAESTVTVVLVGSETWKRKHVDWEIGSSVRHTDPNPRSGLLGILLPTYPLYKEKKYNPHTIPPRLYDNLECGYAELGLWNENPQIIQNWIHAAFDRRFKVNPDNQRISFAKNRSGDRWID